ncbi:MAG: hypothetical protein ORO03_00765 [Alphaproteobacteria bacterium]|nr:hypothetical protein [Alphaproteobacteria bacterium]
MINSVTPNPDPPAEPSRSATGSTVTAPSLDDSSSLVVTIAQKGLEPQTPAASPVASPVLPPAATSVATPAPVSPAVAGAGGASAYPLVSLPPWLTALSRVSVLAGVVVATDGSGVTRILTSFGELSLALPPELAARLPVDTAVRLLLSQVPEQGAATIVITPAEQALPPIDFSQGQKEPSQASRTWPRAALGGEIDLAVAAIPPAGTAARAAGVTNGAAGSEANTAVAIDGLVAVERTGTPISTAFLASLFGQAGSGSLAPSPEAQPRVLVKPQGVSALAISTTTDGFSGPVPILTAGEGGSSGLSTNQATPVASQPRASPTEAELLPEVLKGIETGQTHPVKIAGYFDADGRLVTEYGNQPPSSPKAPLSIEMINQENAKKLFEIGKSFGASNLLIAQAVGQDREGRAVLSMGSALFTADIAPPKLDSLVLLVWHPPRAIESSLKLQAKSAADAFEILLTATLGKGGHAPLAAVVPRLGPHLAAQLGFYLGAARRGEVSLLIAAETRSLLEATPQTKEALHSLTQIIQKQALSEGDGWRTVTIPLEQPTQAPQAPVQPMHWYFHGGAEAADGFNDEETKRAIKNAGIRFIVDLKLNRLGEVQLDGLHRDQSLNLVIRSPQPIELTIRSELNRVFAEVMARKKFGGTIIFQVAPLFVPPITEATTPVQTGILV